MEVAFHKGKGQSLPQGSYKSLESETTFGGEETKAEVNRILAFLKDVPPGAASCHTHTHPQPIINCNSVKISL